MQCVLFVHLDAILFDFALVAVVQIAMCAMCALNVRLAQMEAFHEVHSVIVGL
jgi:hypothetical protein